MKSVLWRMVVITACAQITPKKIDICTRISVLLGVEENLLGRVFCARSVISTLKIRHYTERVDDLERSLLQIFIAVEGRRIRGLFILLHMAFNKGI